MCLKSMIMYLPRKNFYLKFFKYLFEKFKIEEYCRDKKGSIKVKFKLMKILQYKNKEKIVKFVNKD